MYVYMIWMSIVQSYVICIIALFSSTYYWDEFYMCFYVCHFISRNLKFWIFELCIFILLLCIQMSFEFDLTFFYHFLIPFKVILAQPLMMALAVWCCAVRIHLVVPLFAKIWLILWLPLRTRRNILATLLDLMLKTIGR